MSFPPNQPISSSDGLGDAPPVVDSVAPQVESNPIAATHQGVCEGKKGHVASAPFIELAQRMSFVHWFAASLLLFVADIAMFSGHGFTGLALLFLVAPFLIMLTGMHRQSLSVFFVLSMLVVVAVRAVWLGSFLLGFCGFVLIFSMSLVASGFKASLTNLLLHCFVAPFSGISHLFSLAGIWAIRKPCAVRKKNGVAAIVIPLAAISVFGSIFVFANPDLSATVSRFLNDIVFNSSLLKYLPSFSHYWFWCVVGVFAIGLVRPLSRFGPPLDVDVFTSIESQPVSCGDIAECKHFEVFRNTLVSLIFLFIVYLVFEFSTLWFREFPVGFYYAGYAHNGAAWLTFALLLTTVTLSLIFRRELYSDPRVSQIWILSSIWIALNFVLAMAVYNRMWIYVDFNGLTMMRMVGLFGITTVVTGMVLLIFKMKRRQSFSWLVAQDIKALFVAVFLFAVVPIDWIWVSYNVDRVNSGDLPASIQLVAHPIGDDGIRPLIELIHHENETIREGGKAILFLRLDQLAFTNSRRRELGWTAIQLGSEAIQADIQSLLESGSLDSIESTAIAETAKQKFYDYAFQWY